MFSESVEHLVQKNVSLAPHCWLRIGGEASFFAQPTSVEELSTLCRDAAHANLPMRVLGGGSNVLVREAGVEGLVIHLADGLGKIEVNGNSLVAGGAAVLGEVVTSAAAAGLAGIEELAGIPGTIGGAVAGNSGIKNDDIGSRVTKVEGVDREGQLVQLGRDSMRFGFRRSNLENIILTSVELALESAPAEEVTRRLQAAWIVRKASQPPSGARVAQAFIEPSGWRISELLDAAGMRTAAEGEVAMSSQHAGFLVVNENASAEEVLALTARIARAVEVQSGIQLQSQLKIW